MSAQDQIVEALRSEYQLERVDTDSFSITGVGAEAIDPPIQLVVNEALTNRYLETIAAQVIRAGFSDAVDYVKLHVDEQVQSALAMGGTVRSLGVRRSKVLGRPEWYVDTTEAPPLRLEDGEAFEWRA